MSFQLGSEQKIYLDMFVQRLVSMSFQLGSELKIFIFNANWSLVSMSFQLGSEPLFSNLYLIWHKFLGNSSGLQYFIT